MITTILGKIKHLQLGQLIKDIDPWFWVLLIATLVGSWSLVNINAKLSLIEESADGLLQAKQQAFVANDSPVRDAYLRTKGEALGAKYKQRGVVREELVSTLDKLLAEGEINGVYREAVLSGYDSGFTLK